jgi:hypothetical protein
MVSTLLQVNPNALADAASKVQPGDYSGYTFAIIVLSLVLGGSLYAIKNLYEKNTDLQTAAVARAEDTTKALISALNEVKDQYKEFTRSIEHTNEILKDIKSKIQ